MFPFFLAVHYYNYLHDSWVTDNYPMTRFSSEYGFQSLPSLSSLRKVATNEDLAILSSPFMIHRQHLPLGYLYMVYLLMLRFAAPQLNDLKGIIYTTQVNIAKKLNFFEASLYQRLGKIKKPLKSILIFK